MVEKVYEPSRIRRGRLSTTPTWYAVHSGRKLQFSRKKDALKYEAEGCADHQRYFCKCRGWQVIVDAVKSRTP